jgi:hypothetical protein
MYLYVEWSALLEPNLAHYTYHRCSDCVMTTCDSSQGFEQALSNHFP